MQLLELARSKLLIELPQDDLEALKGVKREKLTEGPPAGGDLPRHWGCETENGNG
jgi:hypothetical protein